MEDLMKKQLFYSRIMGISLLGLAISVVVVLLLIVPQVLHTVNNVNDILAEVSVTLETAEESIDQLTKMSKAVETMSGNMNDFVTENANQVAEVMTNIDNIDFEGLNGAIRNLGDVVEPLAKFFNVFKK